jgi:hypothetical protein
MKTTTAMTPMTEATTATGPSLWPWPCPFGCVDVVPDAAVPAAWTATVACTAPWAGMLGAAISQISGAKKAATAATRARRRNPPAGPCRSVERIVVLD